MSIADPACGAGGQATGGWVGAYNTTRRHSACQMMSLVDYERTLAAGKAA